MRKLVVIFIILLCPFMLEAQHNLTAKQLLDRTSDLLLKDSGVKTTFTTAVMRNGKLESLSDGILCVKGKQFVLETEKMKTWYNGEYQWSLIFDMEEVNLSEPTQEELEEINPYELLKLYQRGYSVKYLNPKDNTIVLLKAKDKKKDYQEIRITINEHYQPVTMAVETKDKRMILIEVTEFIKNQNLSSDTFVFNPNKYPDIEIIDLR